MLLIAPDKNVKHLPDKPTYKLSPEYVLLYFMYSNKTTMPEEWASATTMRVQDGKVTNAETTPVGILQPGQTLVITRMVEKGDVIA